MLRRIVTILLWLTIFAIPLENMLVFPGIGTISRLLGIATFACGVLYVLLNGRIRRLTYYPLLAAAFIIGWGVVSLLWSAEPSYTIIRLTTYFQLAALVWLLWEFPEPPRGYQRLMKAYVLGAYCSVIGTFIAYFTAHDTDYLRYAANGFDPNDLSLILAIGMPLAWYLAITATHRVRAVLFALYVPLAFLAVILTASRGSLLAAIAAFGYVAWSFTRLSLPQNTAVITLGVLLVIGMVTLMPATSYARLATTESEMRSGDWNERLDIWRVGAETFWDHVLFGVGVGAFGSVVEPKLGTDYPSDLVAHNTFLSILVERGLVGSLIFALILALAVATVWKLPPPECALWITLLLTWSIGAFGLTFEHRKATWVLFSLLFGHALGKLHEMNVMGGTHE
jgi:O-antigen ligase